MHAVDDDHICTCFDTQRRVIVRASGADFDVDRLLPRCDLTQFLNLDGQIIGAGPVRMSASGPLVDALRQCAHLGNTFGDLLSQKHTAATGLGALADDDFDSVCPAQVVWIHPVPRRQHLIDEFV